MKLAYLLPCSCGQKVEVDSTQAGLSVACRCGRTLEVPTMRHLGELERSGGSEPRATSTWGPRQGYTLIGVLVALLGLGWLGYQISTMPSEIHVVQEDIREDVDALSPAEMAQQYAILREGMDPTEPPIVTATRAYEAWHRRWTYVSGAVTLLGVAIAAGAWLSMGESKTPAGKRRR